MCESNSILKCIVLLQKSLRAIPPAFAGLKAGVVTSSLHLAGLRSVISNVARNSASRTSRLADKRTNLRSQTMQPTLLPFTPPCSRGHINRLATPLLAAAAVLLSAFASFACGGYGFISTPQDLVENAMTGSDAERQQAAAYFMSMGPEGLALLLAIAPVEGSTELRTAPSSLSYAQLQTPRGGVAEAIRPVVEQVARQKDADLSGLYWYTDFDEAKRAAAESGKPIVSLRLLGQLNDELSCANSRFFRTVLYADDQIARTLRNSYVLHWQTVRPVPQITIDFGDGRTMHRTITGNSAHYMHDSEGRLVDVLPGLYGPRAFERWLGDAGQLAYQTSHGDFSDDQRAEHIRQYHASRITAIDGAWVADLQTLGKLPVKERRAVTAASLEDLSTEISVPEAPAAAPAVEGTVRAATKMAAEARTVEEAAITRLPAAEAQNRAVAKAEGEAAVIAKAVDPRGLNRPAANNPADEPGDEVDLQFPRLRNAVFAQRMSMSKSVVEMPMMNLALGERQIRAVQDKTDTATWRQIAELHAAASQLSEGAKMVIARKERQGSAAPQGDLAVLKAKADKTAADSPAGDIIETAGGADTIATGELVSSFQRTLAVDTVRNEYDLHRQIHTWFVESPVVEDRQAFNARVYAELFASPLDDPYMGLYDERIYTALPGAGLTRR